MAIMAVAAMAFATGGCVEPLDNNVRGIDPDAVYLPIRLYIPGAIPTTKVSTGDVKGISAESQIHTVQVWMFSHMDPALLTPAEGETPEQAQAREAALATELDKQAVAYAEARNLSGQTQNLSDGSGYYINETDPYSGGWVAANTYQIPLVLPKQVLELPADDMKFDFYVLANAPSIGFEAGKTATRGSLMNATFGVTETKDYFGTSAPIISIADDGLPISGFFNKGSNGETLASASGVDLSSLRNRTNFTAAELHEILPIVQLERAVSRIRFAFAKPYEGETQNPTQLEITSIEINGNLIPTSTFVFPRENGVVAFPTTPTTYVSTSAVVTGPNSSAFVSSTDIQAKSLLDNPEDLKPDSPKVFSDVDNQKSYYNKAPGGNNTTNPETPAMTPQQYSDLLDDYTASKFVYFRESDQVITGKINYKVNGVVQTAKPFSMVLPSDQNYNNFHRNHSWTVYGYFKGGGLYIKPVVLPWADATPSSYTWSGEAHVAISDKTQGLFAYGWTTANDNTWYVPGSNQKTEWFFRRQDKENPTEDDWNNDWVNSQMVIAPGLNAAGAPIFSNKIQLLSSFAAREGFTGLTLKSDNPNFGFVVYNSTILVGGTQQTISGMSAIMDEVVIPIGDRTTYFYVTPKLEYNYTVPLSGEIPSLPDNCKVAISLVTNEDSPVKVPFNTSVFPGSQDNDEIFMYCVTEAVFKSYYFNITASPRPNNIKPYGKDSNGKINPVDID